MTEEVKENKEIKEAEGATGGEDIARPKHARVSLLMPDEDRDQIENLAEKENKPMTEAVVDLVNKHQSGKK